MQETSLVQVRMVTSQSMVHTCPTFNTVELLSHIEQDTDKWYLWSAFGLEPHV